MNTERNGGETDPIDSAFFPAGVTQIQQRSGFVDQMSARKVVAVEMVFTTMVTTDADNTTIPKTNQVTTQQI